MLGEGSTAMAVPPGVLLPHMQLPPEDPATLLVAGPCRWSGPPLACPPDGLCVLYAWLAAQDPQAWQAVAKDDMGFIVDGKEEQLWKTKAQILLTQILDLMEAEGQSDLAEGLRRGKYPGDEEFAFYARVLGPFLVRPLQEADAFPVIHGRGPVQCEMGFVYSTDAAGHSSGHYLLLRSWAVVRPKIRDPTAATGSKDNSDRLPLNDACDRAGQVSRSSMRHGKSAAHRGEPCGRKLRPNQADESVAQAPGQETAAKARDSTCGRRKQTKAKRRGASQLCSGGAQPCVFHTRSPGSAARRPRDTTHCAFCSEATMQATVVTPAGRARLSKALKSFRACSNSTVFERAMRVLKRWVPAHAAQIEKAAKKAKRRKSVTRKDGRALSATVSTWLTCKARRQSVEAAPTAQARKAYRSAVLADQRWAKKRFYPETPRRPRAPNSELTALVDNDCDLPSASRSDVAIGLQRWCAEGAWGMCRSCHILQLRPLRAQDLQARGHKPDLPKSSCRRCCAKYPHRVPRPEDVPPPLRELSYDVVQALRPVTVDVGPIVRADSGYRKKVRMTTFSWALNKVDIKIAQLPKNLQRQARSALRFLLQSADSLYSHFYNRHDSFLQRHDGQPTPEEARRPLQFIEEPGLETALWPHLYWDANMCESYERLNNRRFRQLAAGGPEAEAELSDADEADNSNDRRRSIKRSFFAKLLSPLLGYGSDFELLQYVYDLHLWTDLGSKRNIADGTAMRIMMRGHPMSPLYWNDVKNGLHDLVRQIGYPHLYWTLAPYERSFPYHAYLLDEMQKLLRERMRLPVFESLHLAHTMLQVTRSLLAGRGNHRGQGWTRHLLGKGQGRDGVHFFTRIEFQDGSKKSGTQQYHGSGRPHVHALFWLQDPAAAELGAVAAATEALPDSEANLSAFVRGSQRDQHGDSRWPLHEGPAQFDPDSGGWLLPHTQDDWEQGVRGYFPDILDSLRCHQDLQSRQGRGLLLAYVAKYVAKWSDSSYDEWLSDASSVTSLCRKVLFEYHPLEPEMVLQLSQGLRQWEFGTVMTGRRSIRAPHPRTDAMEQPSFVKRYMECNWRGEAMSLLEYLRKSGSKGEIAAWLRRRHTEAKEAGTDVCLEDFVQAYAMRGEQVVAVDYLWRLNDHYFGQWCMMHVPFRSLQTFHRVRGVDRVPERYHWFATALALTDEVDGALRGYWRDLSNLVRDMQVEGRTDAIIKDTRLFLEAVTVAVNAYVEGRIDKAEEVAANESSGAQQGGLGQASVTFEGKQMLFFREIQARVDRSLEAQRAKDDVQADRALAQLRDLSNRPLVCSGRPGTGKTTVALDCARRALANGAAVLVTSPTARMSARMRERLDQHETIVVDTAAAAFQFHQPEQEAAYVLCGYTLVLVDEYSQLAAEEFERILRLWTMADRVQETSTNCRAWIRSEHGRARHGSRVKRWNS